MMTTAAVVSTPTQVTHPNRAAVRTFVQAAVPLVLAALAIVPPIVQSVLDDPSIPGSLRVWLLAVAAGIAAVAGIISRVMAIPGVNAWLTSLGVGAAPKLVPPVVVDMQQQDTGKPAAPIVVDPAAGELSQLDQLDGLIPPAPPTNPPTGG